MRSGPLVLGIVGLASCGLLAPVAWYLGAQELSQIRSWRAPQAGSGLAWAGMIMGIIGTIPFLFCVGLVAVAICFASLLAVAA